MSNLQDVVCLGHLRFPLPASAPAPKSTFQGAFYLNSPGTSEREVRETPCLEAPEGGVFPDECLKIRAGEVV